MIRTRPLYINTGKVPVTIIRSAEGSWTGGRYTKATPVEVEIEANVQPVPRGIDTRLKPEGDTTKLAFMVFTNDPIRQKREGDGGYDADIVLWDGDELEVMEVARYQMGVLDHYEAYCVRKEVS
jgi:hypothetical protein